MENIIISTEFECHSCGNMAYQGYVINGKTYDVNCASNDYDTTIVGLFEKSKHDDFIVEQIKMHVNNKNKKDNKYSIFLDDERMPSQIYPKNTLDVMENKNMIICRSFEQAVKLVKEIGVLPFYISFDNDLGVDENGDILLEGKDFAQWLIDQDLDGHFEIQKDFSFFVHSANVIQSKEIKIKLNNYLNFKFNN
jgi:hypothetical protein